jgi:hypothetical protein
MLVNGHAPSMHVKRRGVRWQALARHRCRVPEGILPALDGGVAGARGLRLAPLPPHSKTLSRKR